MTYLLKYFPYDKKNLPYKNITRHYLKSNINIYIEKNEEEYYLVLGETKIEITKTKYKDILVNKKMIEISKTTYYIKKDNDTLEIDEYRNYLEGLKLVTSKKDISSYEWVGEKLPLETKEKDFTKLKVKTTTKDKKTVFYY